MKPRAEREAAVLAAVSETVTQAFLSPFPGRIRLRSALASLSWIPKMRQVAKVEPCR